MSRRILLLSAIGEPLAGLSSQLARCGFLVDVAPDLDAVMRTLRERPPNALIVWAGAGASEDVCASLRALSRLPILAVFSSRNEESAVRWLLAGADSVVCLPCSRPHLEARLEALLRLRSAPPARDLPRAVYQVGDLTVDLEARSATKGGRPLSLRPTGFRLLAALARRAGNVVSHKELLAEVWGPNWTDSPELLRPHVRHLRKQLGDARGAPPASGGLESWRGLGYRLA